MPSHHEIASEIARRILSMERDGQINNVTVIEDIITQMLDNKEQSVDDYLKIREAWNFKPAQGATKPEETKPFGFECLGDAIKEMVKARNIAQETLTTDQFAEAILQAVQCGDFTRFVIVDDQNRNHVGYIPFRREQELIKSQAAYRQRIGQFVLNRLEEITNETGGVIGYRLQLNAEETEKLIKTIETQ